MKRIGNEDFEKFSQFFSKYTNGDVAPLKSIALQQIKNILFEERKKERNKEGKKGREMEIKYLSKKVNKETTCTIYTDFG